MRVAVLGAAGIIAPAIIRDLAESDEFEELTLLDINGAAARAAASEHGGGKASGAAVDASDRQALTLALEDHGLLINAASYPVNLAAMDAALAARCNYIDLGGLYHVTATQLPLDAAFADAGLVAILGCGAGPGKTNVMAARAARELEAVDTIRCASAGHDETPPADGLAVPYALQTLLDEMTEAPMVVRDGEAVALVPLAEGGEIDFPEPIGRRRTLHTLHSEALTLPGILGARDCDFRLALAPAVETALRDLAASGADATSVATARPSPHTWSAQHVEVTGRKAGTATTVTVTALTRPHERWGLGGGIVSTGTVASSTARLLARGALGPLSGVLAPERAIRADALFAELEDRGCRFDIRIAEHQEVHAT